MTGTVHYPARPDRRIRTITTTGMPVRHLLDLTNQHGHRTMCGRVISTHNVLWDRSDKPPCDTCNTLRVEQHERNRHANV